MYRFIEKTKGAVSVFLVIVLVPMLTVAALFVDASKMELAKALAVSAGDLTMNTALTDYDIQLKDLYGILATAQDTSKLYGDLEKYYATCIKSSGLSDSDADDIAQMLINALRNAEGSDDVADLLSMQVSDFKVEKVEGANLANAALLERNIVDFMKYRSPINTGLSFITSLKSFTTLSEQTKLVDYRQKYYEAEQEMMEDALEAYRYLYKYSNSGLYTYEDYQKFAKAFDDAKQPFYDLVKLVIKDKYEGRKGSNKDYGAVPVKFTENAVSAPNYRNTYANQIDSKVHALSAAIANCVPMPERLTHHADKGLYGFQYLIQLNREDVYKQWIEPDSGVGVKKVIHAYKELIETKKNVKVYWQEVTYDVYVPKEVTNADGTKATMYIKETRTKIVKDYDEWDIYEKDYESDEYNDVVRDYGKFLEDFNTKNNALFSSLSEYAKNKNTDTAIVKTKLAGIQDPLKEWQTKAVNAVTYLEGARSKLQSVYDDVKPDGGLDSVKQIWDEAANASSLDGTSMAEQDRAEIKDLNEYIDPAAVKDLIKRINLILYGNEDGIDTGNGLKGIVTQIKEDYVFCPNGGPSYKALLSLTDYSDIKNVLESNIRKETLLHITTNNAELDRTIDAWCKDSVYFNLDSGKTTLFSINWINDETGYPVRFINSDTVASARSSTGNPFYEYLVKHFADGVTEEKVEVSNTAGAQKMSEITGTIKAESEKYTASTHSFPATENEDIKNHVKAGKYPSNTTNVPNLGTTPSAGVNAGDQNGVADKASKGLGDMFGCLADTLLTFGADLRDKLYIADYAISMFSYDTIEAELTEANKKGSSGTESGSSSSGSTIASGGSSAGSGASSGSSKSGNAGSPVNASGIYIQDSTSAAAAPQEVNESAILAPAETSSSGSGPVIQSLTLNPISASANYGYGREVEYIIYGGTNSGNVAAAYASIFAIRLGFNIIYAFTSSEVRETAFSVAVPLSAATMGIVPVPLFQAAIIIGIACIESGIDLVELSQGKEVPLFKTQETWHCSVQGLINTGKELVKDVAEDAVDKGAGLLTDLLDATDEELTSLIAGETGKLETYVDTIVEESILRQANTVIEKVTSLATEAYEAAVLNPSLDRVEYVQSRLTAWRNSIGTSGNGYIDEILRAAIDAVTDDLIEALVDAIETAHQSYDKKITEAVKKASNSIEEVVDGIRKKIKDSIDYGSDRLNSYKNQIVGEIKSSISSGEDKGVDKLKSTLNQYVDGMFGSSAVSGSSSDSVNSSDENSFLASLLAFAYSDYLKLFLLIGLYTNEEALVLRIGDVIQADMGKITENVNYQLSDASSYVRITATLRVKPTFLALPLFADVENNPATNSNWYSFQYTSIKGY